jgi:hypothetical protein
MVRMRELGILFPLFAFPTGLAASSGLLSRYFGRFGRSAVRLLSLIHLTLGEGVTDIKIAAIRQLKVSHIARFRAVLSRKYSCPHLHAYRHVGLI